jgi:hypothetical protein
MKFLQLGSIVAAVIALALAGLLGSSLWVMAQAAPPSQEPPPAATDTGAGEPTVETSAVDVVGLLITPTVGSVPGVCATTTTVQVRANSIIYYCITAHHTGVSGDEALTFHNVRTSLGLNKDISPAFTLTPGEIKSTFTAGIVITDVARADATSFITWTARTEDNDPQPIVNRQVTVDVVNPVLNVTKTVGQDRTTCSTARFLRVPSGQSISFCITLQNTGDITLTSHTIADTPLSINATINYTLPPGGSLAILPTNLGTLGITNGSLERSSVTSAFANNVSVTSRTLSALTATGASTATVDIGNTTVRFTKTVSTQPEDCSKTNTIQVQPGTKVYYCVAIQNTGVINLTTHQLTEANLSIDVTFQYDLAPGATLFVTNDFLARNNLPIVFGPFEIHPRFGTANVIGNTMTYKGSAPGGFSVSATAGTTATYPPTPTNTATSRPNPTSTNTPGPTSTPTFTPIPQSPTPSVTPTFTPITPTPTPTRSYAISLLETPTPRSQVAGIPGAPQQEPTQTPTFDPNQPGQLPPDQSQLPVQDPIVATATQIAVDATSTAVAAVATVAQQSIDSAAATALAEAQAPLPELPADSPLPTPTVDPLLPQIGDSSGLPVAPGLETPTETPTLLPTETLPAQSLPGAEITVLPPEFTVVVGTETPAVVVLVVTNTPEAGVLLPEGQRPIVYPTPTVTPDFVMAAARTFDVAVTTMGWLWFLVGSLVFFVTAGIVAGLFFRQSEASRYELPAPDYWLEEEPSADRLHSSSQSGANADDEWPAELP